MLPYPDDPTVERFVARRASSWRQVESAVVIDLEGIRDPDRTDIAAILAGAPLNDAFDHIELTITVLETGAVRLLLGATTPRDLGLLDEIDVAPLGVTTSDGTLRLASERHGGYGPDPEDVTVAVTLDPLSLTILDAGGKAVVSLPPFDASGAGDARIAPLAWIRQSDPDGTIHRTSTVSVTLEPEERLFGLGARPGPLNLTGTNQVVPSLSARPDDDPSPSRPPFLLSSRGYGLLVHSAAGLTADLGVRLPGVFTIAVPEPTLDLVLFPSNWPRTALSGYARLTGRVGVPEPAAFQVGEAGVGDGSSGDGAPTDVTDMHALVQRALSYGLAVPGFWRAPLGFAEPEVARSPLAARWAQVALLAPVVVQGAAGTHGARRDASDDSVLSTYRALRRRLLPYLLHCARETAQNGLPMVRPLLLEFSWDPVAVDLDDQMLVGRDLMLAPIFSDSAEPVARRLYLPGYANWYDWWTGTLYEGRQWIETTAPPERLPLYVRAGTVIPVTASPTERSDAHDGEATDGVRLLLFAPRDGAIGASVEISDDDLLGVEQERGERKARIFVEGLTDTIHDLEIVGLPAGVKLVDASAPGITLEPGDGHLPGLDGHWTSSIVRLVGGSFTAGLELGW